MKIYDRNPKSSFKNATSELTPHDVEKAELFWIREAQQNMGKDIENGKYKRLCPKMRYDGVYVIRGRSELWMAMTTSFGQGLIKNLNLLCPKPICFTVHRGSKVDTISERIKLFTLLLRKYTLLFPGHLLEHSFLISLILQFKIKKYI